MQKRVEETLEELIEQGTQLNNQIARKVQGEALPAALTGLRIRALNIIGRGLGEQTAHYRELRKISDDPQSSARIRGDATIVLGTLNSALADLRGGLLFDMRSLIEAELLGDFIEQAEVLLEATYYVPAASLIGAVLEDVLRKLCVQHSINLPLKTNLNWLNAELARQDAFNRLVSKQITALADIRNSADHGHPDEFNHEDVDHMIKWVRRFSEEHLR